MEKVGQVIQGDALEVMRALPDNSVDLVFGSPPYEAQRSYEDQPARSGMDWVRWMVEISLESARICRGLCCYIVEGKTKNFEYSATPILLMAEMKYRDTRFRLRKPPVFARWGDARIWRHRLVAQQLRILCLLYGSQNKKAPVRRSNGDRESSEVRNGRRQHESRQE